MTLDLDSAEGLALDLARMAASRTLSAFRAGRAPDGAAHEAEAVMRRAIAARFPGHGVISAAETSRTDADWIWSLTPLSGEAAFTAGLPLWTTVIGLSRRGAPQLGLIAQPCLDEILIGGRPGGARLLRPGQPARAVGVRPCDRLTEAVIATADPDRFNGAELGAWTQVKAAARLAIAGAGACACALLAQGRVDLVAERQLPPWLSPALIAVVQAAGGEVTDWRGGAPGPDSRFLAVGDPRIRDQALLALRRGAV